VNDAQRLLESGRRDLGEVNRAQDVFEGARVIAIHAIRRRGTTRTGYAARRATSSATDPDLSRSNPVRLCVPRTMRSQPLDLACIRMIPTGSPCWTPTVIRTPAASDSRRKAAISAVLLRARALIGSFVGTATTTANSASCARLSASACLNAACAGAEKLTAQECERVSSRRFPCSMAQRKRTTQFATIHARGALAMGHYRRLLTESHRSRVRESRLRRPLSIEARSTPFASLHD
jgi:hypothetical protein